MSEVSASIRALREFVNEYADLKYRLMKDLESWFRLCSAMDVLEDTDMAIQGYLDADESKTGLGETYLHYYGLFQAMSVQQDAVASVYESLHKVKYDMGPDGPLEPVWNVRQTRISAFGHPTERRVREGPKDNRIRYCQVCQISMNKNRFQLGTSNPLADDGDRNDMEDIDTLEMIRRQQEWVADEINKLVSQMAEEQEAYRRSHAGSPLADAFPRDLKYHLGKIHEAVRRGLEEPIYLDLGRASLEIVCDALKRLEDMLDERELTPDTYPSIKLIYDELQHPLEQVRLLFSRQTSGPDLERLEKDCDAFAWFLSNKITGWAGDSLEEVIQEIDQSWEVGD